MCKKKEGGGRESFHKLSFEEKQRVEKNQISILSILEQTKKPDLTMADALNLTLVLTFRGH